MKCNPESSIRIFENFVEKEDLKILDNLCRNAKESDDKWWAEKCPSPEYVEHASGAYRELCKEYEYSLDNVHPLVIKYIKSPCQRVRPPIERQQTLTSVQFRDHSTKIN